MRGVYRIAWTELTAVRREWASLLGYILLTVALGLGPVLAEPLLRDLEEEEEELSESSSEAGGAEPCGRGLPVAVVGELPDWVRLESVLPDADHADVLIRAGEHESRPDLDVLALSERDRASGLARCLRRQRKVERIRRLAEVGVVEYPDAVLDVRVLDAPEARAVELPEASLAGSMGLGVVFMLALGIFTELAPRARASGYLEGLCALPLRAREISAGLWLAGVVVVSVWTAVALAAYGLGSLLTGHERIADPVLFGLPVLIPTLCAVAHRVAIGVPDLRTAAFRMFAFMLAVGGMLGLSVAGWAAQPALGALLPVGGMMLVMLGWLPPGLALVAAGSSLLGAAALLWSATGVVARADRVQGGADEAALRRSEGDYRPEVLLLFLFGLAGTQAWLPSSLVRWPVLTLAVGLVLFFLLPALLSPVLLWLDGSELLSLRRPSWRALLLTPAMVPGSLALSLLGLWVATHWLPLNPELLYQYGLQVQELTGPAGALVLVLAPALCEELLFRGAILGLLRRRGGTWGPVVLQALLFGLAHVLMFKIAVALPLGLLLGLLVVRTGSIWPGVLLHALHNLLAMQLGGEPSAAGELGSEALLAGLALAGLSVLLAWWAGGAPASCDSPPRQEDADAG